MKIALCFYGMATMHTLKYAKKYIHKDISIPLWIKNIIEPNNMDVFIHCWSPEYENIYINNFKPKKYYFEDKKIWPYRKTHHRIIDYDERIDQIMQSVHYSLKQSVCMKSQYENEYNFKYDIVMIARMDIIWFNKLNFNDYNLNSSLIYTSPWNHAFDKNKIMKLPKPYIFDHYIITGSLLADKIANIFDHIDCYLSHETPQIIKYYYFKDNHILDKIRPLFYRFYDHILLRWLFYPLIHLYDKKGNPRTEEWIGFDKQRDILLKNIKEYL
jgi:hypothetical protein